MKIQKRGVFILMLMISLVNVVFGSDRTVETLTNENLTLSEAGELHITSSTTPFSNSTINITSEDAWVFFDNIKPSKVIASYLGSISVNGNSLVNGSNARVAIYAHGTVVMAHGASFKPLTVYAEAEMEGASMQCETQTYYNNLGSFDKTIESFVLKRGYMATFAVNADGSGYSRVFIADEEDLVFNTMPEILQNSVSFIRVFKHQWVTKKGKAGWDPHMLDGTCYYDWNIGGSSSNDVEYAAIRQNGGWPSWDAINSKDGITHLLGFNEPDRPDQSNMTMEAMIAQWPSFMKSGLRIGSPAWSSEWNSVPEGGNLFTFMETCDALNYRVDFVALHCYWVKSPQQWYNDLKYIHERTGRPLWITEWNNGANWTTESWPAGNRDYNDANAQKQLNDMIGILNVLDTASFVERYFIYDWVEDCRAMILGGGLTLAGEYYHDNPSDIAYDSKHNVIPKWTFQDINLEYTYNLKSNSFTLNWEDPNGGLSKAYVIDQKVGTGDFEEVITLENDNSGTSEYTIPASSDIAGEVQFRIRARLSSGSFKPSNTVSVYLTSKEDIMEIGKLTYNNSGYNTCLFSGQFSTTPSVVMGATSFNNQLVNAVPRIYPLLPYYCEFSIQPFDYVDETNFKETEEIGIMAIAPGVYDAGGVEVQANRVSNIKGYWVDVTFEQEFSSVPVVVATQYSKKNSSSMAIAIKNVTTTGFQVKLKAESATTILSENISYVAATQGTGMLDKKRITVARTTSTLANVARYDESYSKPVIFAALQTANDELTSVVRVFNRESFHYYYLYKKEAVASGTSISPDEFGYLIFDIADGQTSAEKLTTAEFEMYPNPAKEVLNFNFEKNTYVEVLSMTGQRLIVGEVKDQLNISNLESGNYLIKVEGMGIKKLVVLP